MPPELPSNIRYTCPEHASKPNPDLHKWPAAYYIGCTVKIAFPAIPHPHNKEHMWVLVTGTRETSSAPQDDKELVGTLDNDPVLDVGYNCGDEVAFNISDIEDLIRGT